MIRTAVGPSVLRGRRAALVTPGAACVRAAILACGATLALARPLPATLIQVPDSIPDPPPPTPAVAVEAAALPKTLETDSVTRSPLTEPRRLLGARMPVTASRILARGLSSGELTGPEATLLAGRAYAAYRSWSAVRRLLLDQPWLGDREGASGYRLLAEAYVGMDSLTRAAEAYQAYLEAEGAPQPPPVEVRVGYGRTLSRLGYATAAALQFEQAAHEHPALRSWLELSAFYRRAEAGDVEETMTLAARLKEDPLVPGDSIAEVLARFAFEQGDPDEGIKVARAAGKGVFTRLAAEYIAPHLSAIGDAEGAETAYRSALETRRPAPEVGPAVLARDSSWEALRDVAISDLRAGRSERGKRYLSEALRIAPESEAPALAEQLAAAHRSAGEHERAIAELGPWLAGRELSPARRGSLWLLAARTFSAMGESRAARQAFETAASGEGVSAALASYLLADGDHDAARLEDAASRYESTAERFPRTTYGARSLSRLAMLDYLEGRYADARLGLEQYRRRYPRGSWYQGALYWTGRTYEAEGDSASARALFLEVIGYDPLDYYAILAEERTGRDRWRALRLQPDQPLPDLDAGFRVALDRMRTLRDLGWTTRARRELEAARSAGPTDPEQLHSLALELSAQGWTQEGVRLAWRVKARRARWSESLLRAVYPLPFREALVDAARNRGLAPELVAGLVRRESLFDPEIVSAANAVGLMQTLPRTARDVARRAGLPEYRRSQLTVPQVNLLLGTRYLSDILGRFGGSRLAGLISYNAGPHRWLVWREFPELAAGNDVFVERIPFRETREYVRAVTELIAIYDRLYGPWDAPEGR